MACVVFTVVLCTSLADLSTIMTVPTVDWASLLTPSSAAHRAEPPGPWTGDGAAVDRIAEHFNAPGFKLRLRDGVEDTAPLSEREMIFLVRPCLTCRWTRSVADQQSRETMIRFVP
jgi:hypothetical protein